MRTFLRVIALAAPLAGLLAADTLVLNDGTRYTGTFVAGNRNRIVFNTDNNGRRAFDRGDVRFLRFGDSRSGDNDYGSSDRMRGDSDRMDTGYRRTTDRDRNSGYSNSGYSNSSNSGYGYNNDSYNDFNRVYQTMGSSLGSPTGDIQTLNDNRGQVRRFENGSVYWTRDTGAHAVSGAILRAWQRAGAETSQLGYPISDELDASRNGYTRVQQFEHGNIYLDDYGRAHIEYTR